MEGMNQGDSVRRVIFVFLLRICHFAFIGIVLHAAHARHELFAECPGLWETMLFILVNKCLHITVCGLILHRFDVRKKISDYASMVVHAIYFTIECTVTSCSLNSQSCLEVMGAPFGGPPLIAYVNVVSCVWDGCVVLSTAMFISIGFRR